MAKKWLVSNCFLTILALLFILNLFLSFSFLSRSVLFFRWSRSVLVYTWHTCVQSPEPGLSSARHMETSPREGEPYRLRPSGLPPSPRFSLIHKASSQSFPSPSALHIRAISPSPLHQSGFLAPNLLKASAAIACVAACLFKVPRGRYVSFFRFKSV
jgi:hypothetical protein